MEKHTTLTQQETLRAASVRTLPPGGDRRMRQARLCIAASLLSILPMILCYSLWHWAGDPADPWCFWLLVCITPPCSVAALGFAVRSLLKRETVAGIVLTVLFSAQLMNAAALYGMEIPEAIRDLRYLERLMESSASGEASAEREGGAP